MVSALSKFDKANVVHNQSALSKFDKAPDKARVKASIV